MIVQTEEQADLCRSRFGRDPIVIKSVAEPQPPAGAPEAFLWVGRLAGYKRPRRFAFTDEVGRNTVGKLDYDWARRALHPPSDVDAPR